MPNIVYEMMGEAGNRDGIVSERWKLTMFTVKSGPDNYLSTTNQNKEKIDRSL